MNATLLGALVLVSLGASVSAEIYATTEDGLEVVLSADGTWRYSNPGQALAHQIEEHYWRGLALDATKAAAFFLVVYGLFWFLRRRHPPLTPVQRALHRLDQLIHLDLRKVLSAPIRLARGSISKSKVPPPPEMAISATSLSIRRHSRINSSPSISGIYYIGQYNVKFTGHNQVKSVPAVHRLNHVIPPHLEQVDKEF